MPLALTTVLTLPMSDPTAGLIKGRFPVRPNLTIHLTIVGRKLQKCSVDMRGARQRRMDVVSAEG